MTTSSISTRLMISSSTPERIGRCLYVKMSCNTVFSSDAFIDWRFVSLCRTPMGSLACQPIRALRCVTTAELRLCLHSIPHTNAPTMAKGLGVTAPLPRGPVPSCEEEDGTCDLPETSAKCGCTAGGAAICRPQAGAAII
eukprot:CAMPEP_0178428108 /NCGR_PEP_ID=MMETSP0689_2-20121128/30100_1 /TAXON_ID=160604 /ORGANISM="Amphidinium massartii, Strain CS-259" /LENGTH=139 /DNA_ID=CAMNT_0020049855 /DNA_START=375 /DNA_END=791 /DNA_ORIENTATION=+